MVNKENDDLVIMIINGADDKVKIDSFKHWLNASVRNHFNDFKLVKLHMLPNTNYLDMLEEVKSIVKNYKNFIITTDSACGYAFDVYKIVLDVAESKDDIRLLYCQNGFLYQDAELRDTGVAEVPLTKCLSIYDQAGAIEIANQLYDVVYKPNGKCILYTATSVNIINDLGELKSRHHHHYKFLQPYWKTVVK